MRRSVVVAIAVITAQEQLSVQRKSARRAASALAGKLPRVLYATDLDPSRQFGSMEEGLFLLASAFSSEGGTLVSLFAKDFDDEGRRRYTDAGLASEHLDLNTFSFSKLSALIAIIKRHNIQWIHWHFFPPIRNKYVWFLSFLLPRVRHILTEHTSPAVNVSRPDGWLKSQAKRVALKRYVRIWCGTHFVKRYLEEQRGWRRIQHVSYFINTDRFRPDLRERNRLRTQLNAGDDFVALLVAYMIPEKGIDTALKAIASLDFPIQLWLVGDGPQRFALGQQCDALGTSNRVKFLKNQSHVESFMQAADCLICPSRWAEAAGLVNIEALSCGLPVIATRVGGIPEIVVDKVTGLLFPADDSAALAAHLVKLKTQPETLAQMKTQARDECLQSFSHRTGIHRFLELYRSLGNP